MGLESYEKVYEFNTVCTRQTLFSCMSACVIFDCVFFWYVFFLFVCFFTINENIWFCSTESQRLIQQCFCVFVYRVDPLLRACPGQSGHPSYLHSQVSSADHGLPGQRLLLQTAGELSLPEQLVLVKAGGEGLKKRWGKLEK